MDQVSQVRGKTDLISLISEYIPLKKTGRNFKANCPFHSEKSPSFVASPERQIWHCFGCQKGGDVFSFLMEYEKMDFPEALRTLAQKAGIELKNDFIDKGVYSQKENIYKLNALAAKFYNFILTEHKSGKEALSYLEKTRLMSLALVKTYSLGFSPDESALSNYLMKKKGYEKNDLLDAGLAFEKNGRIVDFFRNRIMFPLTDHRGNIVGFSGRILTDGDFSGPKYINTRETLVYHKGDLFFGLNSAKDEIKSKNEAIIVEGEFDCLSLFKEGIKNVVAIKGTALTENQATLLSRFTQKVTLCLDTDNAGFEATKRSLSSLEKNNLLVNVILITNGKDPDEAIKNSPALFKKALKNNIPIYDFLISSSLSVNTNTTAEGKRKITDELLPLIAQISNEVIKEHYLKKLADSISTSYESLIREEEKIKSGAEKKELNFQTKDKRDRRELLEEYFVSLILQSENPKEIIDEINKFLTGYNFENLALGKIVLRLSDYFKKSNDFKVKNFSKTLPSELVKTFDTSYIFPLPVLSNKESFDKEVNKVVLSLSEFGVKDVVKKQANAVLQKS